MFVASVVSSVPSCAACLSCMLLAMPQEPITTHAIMGLVLVSVGVLLGALGSVVKYFHNKPFPPTRYACVWCPWAF